LWYRRDIDSELAKKRNNIFKKVLLVLLIAISILPFILYQGDILFGRKMARKKGG